MDRHGERSVLELRRTAPPEAPFSAIPASWRDAPTGPRVERGGLLGRPAQPIGASARARPRGRSSGGSTALVVRLLLLARAGRGEHGGLRRVGRLAGALAVRRLAVAAVGRLAVAVGAGLAGTVRG